MATSLTEALNRLSGTFSPTFTESNPITTSDPTPATPTDGSSTLGNTVMNMIPGPVGALFDLFGVELSLSRVAAFIMGVIVLAGALFLFGADELVQTAKKIPKVIA